MQTFLASSQGVGGRGGTGLSGWVVSARHKGGWDHTGILGIENAAVTAAVEVTALLDQPSPTSCCALRGLSHCTFRGAGTGVRRPEELVWILCGINDERVVCEEIVILPAVVISITFLRACCFCSWNTW